MESQREKPWAWIVFFGGWTVVALVVIVVAWVGGASMEARAFNRATGKHVTTWDAMFLDLRVQEGVK